MKKIILLSICASSLSAAPAQSQLDTFKLYKEKVPGAWSQRPDTMIVNSQQPISSQPNTNAPVPPPLTDPINNPTSGQTNKPEYNEPATVPPPVQRPATKPRKRKQTTPAKPNKNAVDHDSIPGNRHTTLAVFC